MHASPSPFNPLSFWLPSFLAPSSSSASGAGDRDTLGPVLGQMQRLDGYNLWIPSDSKPGAAMVVMLHGAGQSADDFAAGTLMNAAAQQVGMIVLYPNQGVDINAYRCWSWFNGDDQTRESRDTDRIASLTRRVAIEHSVDQSRIYVAGMSAGGAMAALLGQLFPELYAAVGVHSGLAAHASDDLSSAMSAMRSGAVGRPMGREIPTIVFHGDRDATVHPLNGLRVIEGAIGMEGEVMKQDERMCNGRRVTRQNLRSKSGTECEHWVVHDAGHAWSGGSHAGSFADATGPSASEAMLLFFGKASKRLASRGRRHVGRAIQAVR